MTVLSQHNLSFTECIFRYISVSNGHGMNEKNCLKPNKVKTKLSLTSLKLLPLPASPP